MQSCVSKGSSAGRNRCSMHQGADECGHSGGGYGSGGNGAKAVVMEMMHGMSEVVVGLVVAVIVVPAVVAAIAPATIGHVAYAICPTAWCVMVYCGCRMMHLGTAMSHGRSVLSNRTIVCLLASATHFEAAATAHDHLPAGAAMRPHVVPGTATTLCHRVHTCCHQGCQHHCSHSLHCLHSRIALMCLCIFVFVLMQRYGVSAKDTAAQSLCLQGNLPIREGESRLHAAISLFSRVFETHRISVFCLAARPFSLAKAQGRTGVTAHFIQAPKMSYRW